VSMVTFLAHFLFILAGWTLLIKYVLPFIFAANEALPLTHYVMWDFWWVAHIALGWSLLNWRRHTYAFAMVVSVVEIIIVVTKFVYFLSAPEWTIWTMNWFVNKVFVLVCFVLMLGYFLRFAERLRYMSAMSTRGAW